MSSNLARYMTYVLKLDILQSGLFSALPFVAYLIVNLSVGYIGDFLINKSYMSRTNLRKLYGTICLFFFSLVELPKVYNIFSRRPYFFAWCNSTCVLLRVQQDFGNCLFCNWSWINGNICVRN